MAFRRTLAKRLFEMNRDHPNGSAISTLNQSKAPKINSQREFFTSPESLQTGVFRRFFQRRGINQAARLPDFLSVPVGDKLREKLRSLNIAGDRLRLDGLRPPVPDRDLGAVSVDDARKILKSSQVEKVRLRLRQIPDNSISYSAFVKACCDGCATREQGLELAKMLDDSGAVIVLGNVVFLRPDEVAKTMEKIISESFGMPNDPRRWELEHMEREKAAIDEKARSLVRGELYCGLGFLVLQTLGFMRLTFWELSWDVMEPICFFVTSLHFALAYGFFLRTSKEPSFEGYFQRRFKVKQKKLMEAYKFDLVKYNKLKQAFYPVGPSPADYSGLGADTNSHGRSPVFVGPSLG